MRDYLSLYLNGQPISVGGTDAFETLSDFLRRRSRLTGTKVVCAEGDCGACAVLIGRATADGTSIGYRAVASCIQTMFQLDGAHIVTVEGLSAHNLLNPIQQSMVKCHGAQCGYCTPGFVVSLYDIMQAGQPVNTAGIRRGLVGNLCRCTGYDSIIRAAIDTDRTQLKSIDAIYPSEAMLAGMNAASVDELRIELNDLIFFKPNSIESAIRFRNENPTCLIVSGATDLGVQRNKGIRPFTIIMTTAGLKTLRQIIVEPHAISVGAAVTLAELEQSTATVLPEFSHFMAYFGSPMIKNAATIAGNLVNASPIGDTIPALTVLGAEVEITGSARARWVPLAKFYTGYRQTILTTGEMLTRVRIPIPDRDVVFRLFKVSKRKDLDISSVSLAVWMREMSGVIAEIRIAFGGVAATVVRMNDVETFLVGKPATLENFEAAGAMAAEAVKPLTDVRGSDVYRKRLVENLLVKFWHERGGGSGVEAPPTDPATPHAQNGDVRLLDGDAKDDEAINSMMNR